MTTKITQPEGANPQVTGQSFSVNPHVYWLNPNLKEPTRAAVSLNIGGAYAVHGIKITRGKEGELFVSMPSYKKGNSNYKDIFHPITAHSREQMNDLVMRAYEQKLTEQSQNETFVVEPQNESQAVETEQSIGIQTM